MDVSTASFTFSHFNPSYQIHRYISLLYELHIRCKYLCSNINQHKHTCWSEQFSDAQYKSFSPGRNIVAYFSCGRTHFHGNKIDGGSICPGTQTSCSIGEVVTDIVDLPGSWASSCGTWYVTMIATLPHGLCILGDGSKIPRFNITAK